MTEQLTSTRPYLLRAIHEWLSDNGQTPLIVVDAGMADVKVPETYINDGRIVLNIDWSATRNLQLGNESISFEARFGGVSHHVDVPLVAVQGIYSRESGQGMLFENEPGNAQELGAEALQPASLAPQADDSGSQGGNDNDDRPPPKGPGLRLVK